MGKHHIPVLSTVSGPFIFIELDCGRLGFIDLEILLSCTLLAGECAE